MEMDYRLVENEGLFQEYLEMGELLLYLSIFFPVTRISLDLSLKVQKVLLFPSMPLNFCGQGIVEVAFT